VEAPGIARAHPVHQAIPHPHLPPNQNPNQRQNQLIKSIHQRSRSIREAAKCCRFFLVLEIELPQVLLLQKRHKTKNVK
jgi:hypothetical protein